MSMKTADFKREGTPFEVFQIGVNHAEIRKQIELTLEQIYEDSKREGIIYSLSKYKNEYMTGIYLQRLIDLGILKRLTSGNKNILYEWNLGDNPDFTDLTKHILTGSKF